MHRRQGAGGREKAGNSWVVSICMRGSSVSERSSDGAPMRGDNDGFGCSAGRDGHNAA